MDAHDREGVAGRVLVADGDGSTRALIRSILGREGLRVTEAADGAAAAELLAHEPFDLVVAGCGRDGAGVPARDDARPSDAPAVLALVTAGDAAGALAALAGGADDYLTRPIHAAELLVRARACLRGDRRRAAVEQAALRRIAVAVAREGAPQAVFDLVAEELARAHGVAGAAVVRFDDDAAVFVGRWSRRPRAWPPRELRVPIDAPLPSCVVARTGRAARADDFRPYAAALPWVLDEAAFRGSVAAPVRVGERLWGAVVVATDRPAPLAVGTEERLERFAELVALAIGNAEARAELARRAATDALTGLVNRGAFEERLAEEVARARRHGRDLALAVLDLDRFKAVNDTHGHLAGDEVLREAALRLAARTREVDVLARIGGEEFAWLMPETDGMEAWQAAERARADMAGALFPEVGRVTISAGVCELALAEGPNDLYGKADAALYWAKRNGRDVVFLYTPEAMAAMSEEERAAELKREQALRSLRVLARAVDAKDPSTKRHSERVAGLAASIAESLGWAPGRVALLHEAGLVHDVGKIAVPDAILFKPGRLGADELAKVQLHAALGAEMLSDVLAAEQAAWVRAHHERWDGTGYPDGLAGDRVPEGARILHLADAWDVMTSRRPYMPPMSGAEAMLECRRLAGAQFWERAVDALEALWGAGALEPEALERRAAMEPIA